MLGVPQPAGLYDGFDLLRLCGSQCGYIGVFGKQILHHNIHTGIGALGSQTYTDQQLPGVVVIQRTPGIRVFGFQAVDHFQRQHLFLQ